MEIIKLGFFLTLLTVCFAQTSKPMKLKKNTGRTYVCPPKFNRIGHRCIHFSETKMSWPEAYHECRDRHSNLAIIKTKFQNKLITRTLNSSSDRFDRWLGSKYDWKNEEWRWAASGHKLTYRNFYTNDTLGNDLKWHCLYIDPEHGYRWNADSCLKSKHFICHTKIKMVTNKGKKKLKRQYNVNRFNKLNEIPVPLTPGSKNITNLKSDINSQFQADFAYKPRPHRRRSKDRRKNLEGIQIKETKYDNGTASISFDMPPFVRVPSESKRSRRKNVDEIVHVNGAKKNIRWNSFYQDPKNPLYPRPNIQTYSFAKE